jgi:hypothetical protein
MLGKLLTGSKTLEHEILLRKAVLKIQNSNEDVNFLGS